MGKKKAEWEARQGAIAKKKAEQEIILPQGRSLVAAQGNLSLTWETASQSTEASMAAPSTPLDMKEAERLPAAEKDVRKLETALREITKLEGRRDLNNKQRAKLACKPDVEADLDSACFARARELVCELRRASQV